jgi:drug/metabolite transporter (DMT)-like permease
MAYILAYTIIPVAVAVSIFYVYPLIVAGIICVRERQPPGYGVSGGLVLGLGGVWLLVGPSFGGMNLLGLALALLAAISAATNVTVSATAMRQASPFLTTIIISLSALLPLSVLSLHGGMSMPSGTHAILAFALATLTSSTGIVLLYVGIRLAGSLPATMISNIEPVVSILMASALLGESLGMHQLSGVGSILAGIVLLQLSAAQRSR